MGIHYANQQETTTENPTPPQPKSGGLKIVLSILVVVLVVGNALTLYLLFNKKEDSKPAPFTPPVVNITNTDDDILDNNTTVDGEIIDNNQDDDVNIDLTEGEIFMSWNEWPTIVNHYDVFNGLELKPILEAEEDFSGTYESLMDRVKVYKIGTVEQGPYQDNTLYMVSVRPDGIAFRDNLYRVIKDADRNTILLTKHSDDASPHSAHEKLFTSINNEITITNVETPVNINVPNSDLQLKKIGEEGFRMANTYNNPEKLFTYDGGDIYKYNNCFFSTADDGSVTNYYLDLDFKGESVENTRIHVNPEILNFTWTDGSQNTNEYSYKRLYNMGWGEGCYDYAYYIDDMSQLKQVGQTPSGDAIYELADQSIKETPGSEKSMLEMMHARQYVPEGQEELSFEDFLDAKPLLFWQDPFGDLLVMKNADFMQAVEMAKPVIYLYPETDTDVSVKVHPNKGLTITEPDYKNGWFVKATPSGILYNYDDKTAYPYLFWEGHGLDYDRPQEGFVVAQNEIKSFLISKLEQQGLIAKEYNEFIEYWEPLMKEKPYYFITFVPQAKFDRLAPLEINPQPDTIIRVFMDYQGLDTLVKVKPQTLTTPERNGFTGVEWGGARR